MFQHEVYSIPCITSILQSTSNEKKFNLTTLIECSYLGRTIKSPYLTFDRSLNANDTLDGVYRFKSDHSN